MQDTKGQNTLDVFTLMKVVRQQLSIWHKQQEEVEQRLQVFRQRQQDLQAYLDILQMEQEYLAMLRREQERKHAERLRKQARSMKIPDHS